jgi:hypothetical protein
MDRKAISKWTKLASLLVMVMLPVMYVVAYLALTQDMVRISGRLHRDFSSSYLATAFRPCAWAESKVTSEEVGTCCISDVFNGL